MAWDLLKFEWLPLAMNISKFDPVVLVDARCIELGYEP
jgi:hypothetical protein